MKRIISFFIGLFDSIPRWIICVAMALGTIGLLLLFAEFCAWCYSIEPVVFLIVVFFALGLNIVGLLAYLFYVIFFDD